MCITDREMHSGNMQNHGYNTVLVVAVSACGVDIARGVIDNRDYVRYVVYSIYGGRTLTHALKGQRSWVAFHHQEWR